jgi:hypothetical protein
MLNEVDFRLKGECMGIKKTAGMSVLSVSVATISCIGMTGSFAAADSITTTGPGSYNVIESGANTYGGYMGYSSAPSSDNWSSMNPATWQSQGKSFTSWWMAMMSDMDKYNSTCFSNHMTSVSKWMPTGSNWESSWTNWDPYLWMSNGQGFNTWHTQMMGYLDGQYMQYMNGWNNNQQPVAPQGGGSNISDTGPGSVNAITTSANYGVNYRVVNENNVSTSNNNNQSAQTGNASSYGNTIGGDVSTGSAYNQNENQTSVNTSNDTPTFSGLNGGSGYGEGGTIHLTGPGSYNAITSSDNQNYSEYNSNTVNTSNNSSQNARSGNASSDYNTIGGNTSSGGAYNSNGNYDSVDASNQ